MRRAPVTPGSRQSTDRAPMDAFFLHATMLLVVLAPLPLGANREWAWTLTACLVAALALFAALREIWRPSCRPSPLLCWSIALFGLVLLWAWVQAVSWTPESWHHPVWSLAIRVMQDSVAASVSLSPDDTRVAAMRLSTYALVFALTFVSARDRHLAQQGLRWLAAAGMAYAVYGLAVYTARSGTVLWLHNPGWVRDVRATFINHNSFATWAGLCLLSALTLYYQAATLRRNPAYRLPMELGVRLEQFLLRTWKPLTAVLMLTAGLVLSHSRGGFISLCAGAAVLLMAVHIRQPLREAIARKTLWTAVFAVVLVFWLTSEVMLSRIDRLTADYQSRLDAYHLTLEGIRDNPLLGFGYGTFAESMRFYRDERIAGFFDKAHNTYLENIMELGWPVALALLASLTMLVAICWRGMRRRRRDWIIPATGLAATALVAVHATVDFSLQIPAVAMAYAAILGIACAQSRDN